MSQFKMKLITPIFVLFVCVYSLFSYGALVARDLDGNFSNGHEGVYDTVLNITWLANANLAAAESFGVEGIVTEAGPGRMTHGTAIEWVSAMNSTDSGTGYLGISTWRLPAVSPLGGSAFFNLTNSLDGSSDRGMQISAPVDSVYNPVGKSAGATNSELAYHFYNNFRATGECWYTVSGDTACTDGYTSGLYGAPDPENNKALFENLFLGGILWTDTTLFDGRVFIFNFSNGAQSTAVPSGFSNPLRHVWAVTDGDVGVQIVPLPGGIILYLSAMLAFFYRVIFKKVRDAS